MMQYEHYIIRYDSSYCLNKFVGCRIKNIYNVCNKSFIFLLHNIMQLKSVIVLQTDRHKDRHVQS